MRTNTNISTNNYAALYAFASKERDTETGLSYFGARYYSSDLSIWLSVDPMIDKYPSFSPYVYCANNPIKLVDPNGEEVSNPDDPPKNNNLFQSGWEAFKRFDQSLEGHSDCANQGTNTKQDVEVGVAVIATMMSAGAVLEAGTAVETTVAVSSTINSFDNATISSSGLTASQRVSDSNPEVNKIVNTSKKVVSAASIAHSASKIKTFIKDAAKDGAMVIKKEATKIASNAVNIASSARSLIKSLISKKK